MVKRKEARVCHCIHCTQYSKYKQNVYRANNRKIRQSTNRQLKKLNDYEDFSQVLISGGYTD